MFVSAFLKIYKINCIFLKLSRYDNLEKTVKMKKLKLKIGSVAFEIKS